ncbi:MAG TPA: molybdenum cofactor guanylyltransferase [Candidatus Angelobacter sp.]|nr:molybdenum cofactor guanylyltransferase [Candidatus Angelobacter sp.]
MAPHQITGFVLAGGKSSRMGADKAALSLNGRTLLEHALGAIRQVSEQVLIIGSRALYGGFGPGYEDIVSGCGPLGGVHAALTHSTTELNLIIAVDTPFLVPELLRYLAERATDASCMIVAPRIAGHVQPLCAVYSRKFLPIAAAALQTGKYKLASLFPQESTLVVTEPELEEFAFTANMFENLNTPEDMERARGVAREAKS